MKEQIGKMLEYNKVFVEHELYKKYTTTVETSETTGRVSSESEVYVSNMPKPMKMMQVILPPFCNMKYTSCEINFILCRI